MAVIVPVVISVAAKLVVEIPVRARIVPLTSNLYTGDVVLIPTLPPVV